MCFILLPLQFASIFYLFIEKLQNIPITSSFTLQFKDILLLIYKLRKYNTQKFSTDINIFKMNTSELN